MTAVVNPNQMPFIFLTQQNIVFSSSNSKSKLPFATSIAFSPTCFFFTSLSLSLFLSHFISFGEPVTAFERIKDYSFNHVVNFTCFTILEYICRAHQNEGYLDVYVSSNDKTDDTNKTKLTNSQ